jgi:hypothetical protein
MLTDCYMLCHSAVCAPFSAYRQVCDSVKRERIELQGLAVTVHTWAGGLASLLLAAPVQLF